jgi:hypothetical protein
MYVRNERKQTDIAACTNTKKEKIITKTNEEIKRKLLLNINIFLLVFPSADSVIIINKFT